MCAKKFGALIPKKFLCRYPLDLGALCVGIVMTCIMAVIAIATVVQIIYVLDCNKCPSFAIRNCCGYSVTAFIYSIIMLLVHAWFLWGVSKCKTSVILSWIVIASMWLAHTFCLLIVLICLYSADASFVSWILCLLFGIIAIGILLYGLLVVVGFWLELKSKKSSPLPA
ncbi:uncharacterized protein [Choristoneura fumiferana]|uniref:uncharacterized protein n=1 Tax=Choristoneura fumiferana TaxID=7141 RepID=UPI003D15C057